MPLFMYELDIHIRCLSPKEFRAYKKECSEQYNRWNDWLRRGMPQDEVDKV